MKKFLTPILMLVLVFVIAGNVSAMEIQGLFGGADYFGGGVILEDTTEIADQSIGTVIMGTYSNPGISADNNAVEILAGLHWDKVKFGDTVTDAFNYQFGLGYNTSDSIYGGVVYFAKTSYQITDSISAGLLYSSSSGGALTTSFSF